MENPADTHRRDQPSEPTGDVVADRESSDVVSFDAVWTIGASAIGTLDMTDRFNRGVVAGYLLATDARESRDLWEPLPIDET